VTAIGTERTVRCAGLTRVGNDQETERCSSGISTSGTTISTHAQRSFNCCGQGTQEWQAAGNLVNTATAPSVLYGDDMLRIRRQ
jgi:hypothetical protein